MNATTRTDGATQTDSRRLGGKYLTFVLAREPFGIELLRVREVVDLPAITAVPNAPAGMKGVVDVGGNATPVMDLRLRLGLPAAEAANRMCIIVADPGQAETAIIVDEICEVLNIASEDIEPPPAFGSPVDPSFILGIGKVNNRPTILLDIGRVLAGTEAPAHDLEAASVSGR